MGNRIIRTGLSNQYSDMLNAVLGQLSDGYWENTPMMAGYWKFAGIGSDGGNATIEVSDCNSEYSRYTGKTTYNRFVDMSDDAIRRFFADKIKFLIKEEGLGPWSRGNENETVYLSYDKPYRVKDCYYAYEILKGRNAGRHPEYSDVAESEMKTDEGILQSRLENVAQIAGGLTYDAAWRLDFAAKDDAELRKKIQGLLDDFENAAGEDDDTGMENAAKKLKELADALPAGKGEGKKCEGREGWDDWEEVEGLEEVLESIDSLAYELRTSVRGSSTGCRTWADLSEYVKGLAADLAKAGENISYMSEKEDESKKKSPSKKFSSTVEEDPDGKKLSH